MRPLARTLLACAPIRKSDAVKHRGLHVVYAVSVRIAGVIAVRHDRRLDRVSIVSRQVSEHALPHE